MQDSGGFTTLKLRILNLNFMIPHNQVLFVIIIIMSNTVLQKQAAFISSIP
jgi:hypothetical protein